MSSRPRVVVIGSGPSGVYAADEAGKLGYQVDVLDRLPCPYGLLRYGVAPDHLKMKSMEATLRKVLERDTVRFLGGIELGVTVTVAELASRYHAIIYATGASTDRRLGIPGEDLPGSVAATDFVRWYSGHPDAVAGEFALDATSVVVIGMGNVAVDVARVLAKRWDEFLGTDVHGDVLETLERSAVTDIHIVGRRGPAHAKFTTKELRELGELGNADVLVEAAELELDEAGKLAIEQDSTLKRNYQVLQDWSTRPLQGKRRRIHLRFLASPRRVLGDTRVAAIELERNVVDDQGRARGTGEVTTIPAQLVLRSIGYRGSPLPGVPFDEDTGIIPNERGRVLRDGKVAEGEYVVGWIKRGPTGVIGTNKSDARETVAVLAEDLARAESANVSAAEDLAGYLAGRGVTTCTWQGWQAIDAAEKALGEAAGRTRIKIADWRQLWDVAGQAAS